MCATEITELRTAWETCPSCRGSGMGMNGLDVGLCYECKGDTMIRIRDERGRFTTKPYRVCECGSRPYEIGGAEHKDGCPAQGY